VSINALVNSFVTSTKQVPAIGGKLAGTPREEEALLLVYRLETAAGYCLLVKVIHPTRHKIGHFLFPANLLTSTEKTKSKPGETTTAIYNKPRLTRITKFTTT